MPEENLDASYQEALKAQKDGTAIPVLPPDVPGMLNLLTPEDWEEFRQAYGDDFVKRLKAKGGIP